MFFSARPAKGFPLAVDMDISTMHFLRSIRDPEDVAWAAEDGRMMCRPSWSEMATELACLKLGARMRAEFSEISAL